MRRENYHASSLANDEKNSTVGFNCLHYSVSEGAGYLLVRITSKLSPALRIGVRTVAGEAIAPTDYEAVDQEVAFEKAGNSEIKIKIKDDEEWEPDKDFFVEIYDLQTKLRLPGQDTRSKVTIIDDDRPGVLAFEC